MSNTFIYAMDRAKKAVEEAVRSIFEQGVEVTIEYPPPNIPADLAVPCFPYARILRKAPPLIAKELAEKINGMNLEVIKEASVAGGYLNIVYNRETILSEIFKDIEEYGEHYGDLNVGKGRTVVMDYSSPNIAKPFSVGNIRSTVTGHAIYKILGAAGYNVIGDNHIGDWGTQFGKLIYAYKTWGSEEKVKADPIKELLALYVKFHDEAEKDPTVEDEGRKCFKELEEGDSEAQKLWKWFVEVSMDEFNRVYERLGVKHDYILGESFYNDKTEEIIKMIEDAGLAEKEESGALIVRLDEHGIDTPVLIRKSDGATLYATRELASILYRVREFDPDKLLYVVGGEQKLHFSQCFKVMELLGFDKVDFKHVDFGLVSLKEGKMSTRKGRVIFFEDVLDEAKSRVLEILGDKRPDLDDAERELIAEVVGVGAVKFNDLAQNRVKNVVFDWDKMLSFDGDTAPYLQYSYARVRSILRKAEEKGLKPELHPEILKEETAVNLTKALALFPEKVKDAADGFHPHIIAQYLLEVSRVFASFYQNTPVLKAESEDLAKARLGLVDAYSLVIRRGLDLLGIRVLERM